MNTKQLSDSFLLRYFIRLSLMMTRGQGSVKSPVKSDRFDEILASIKQANENNNSKFTQIFTQLKDIQDSQKAQLEAQTKRITSLESENRQLRQDLNATNTRLSKCEELLEKAQAKITENESHGRRLNLILGNVPEFNNENIRETLNRVFIDHLKIPRERAEGFILRDAHRLGKSKQENPPIPGVTKPRNIIMAFICQEDRNYVYGQAKNLKGSQISLRVDLVKEYAVIRDKLLIHRSEIRKFNEKLYVQLTYRSYSRPVLLVKMGNNIVEFKEGMKYEDLQEVSGRGK